MFNVNQCVFSLTFQTAQATQLFQTIGFVAIMGIYVVNLQFVCHLPSPAPSTNAFLNFSHCQKVQCVSPFFLPMLERTSSFLIHEIGCVT